MKRLGFLGVLATLLVLMLASTVMAGGSGTVTGTIRAPTVAVGIAGTTLFNVTWADHLNNISNVTFYIGTTQICSNTTTGNGNISTVANGASCRVDSKAYALYDSTTYTVTAKFYNSTNVEINTAATLAGIPVDNTNPTCTIDTTIVKASASTKFPVWLKSAAKNASSCYFTLNNKVYTGTFNGSALSEECHVTIHSTDLPAGFYTVSVTTTDSSATPDTATCTKEHVGFEKEVSQIKGAVIDDEEFEEVYAAEDKKSENTTVIVLVVVAVVAYFLFFHKKK